MSSASIVPNNKSVHSIVGTPYGVRNTSNVCPTSIRTPYSVLDTHRKLKTPYADWICNHLPTLMIIHKCDWIVVSQITSNEAHFTSARLHLRFSLHRVFLCSVSVCVFNVGQTGGPCEAPLAWRRAKALKIIFNTSPQVPVQVVSQHLAIHHIEFTFTFTPAPP